MLSVREREGVERHKREADQSATCSVKVDNVWSYIYIPEHVFME
jgi:hypothetical protein